MSHNHANHDASSFAIGYKGYHKDSVGVPLGIRGSCGALTSLHTHARHAGGWSSSNLMGWSGVGRCGMGKVGMGWDGC